MATQTQKDKEEEGEWEEEGKRWEEEVVVEHHSDRKAEDPHPRRDPLLTAPRDTMATQIQEDKEEEERKEEETWDGERW